MKLYNLMCALPVPRSYLGKVLLVSFLGVHVPMIGVMIYVLLSVDVSLADALGMLAALLVATLLGTLATMAALYALLSPVSEAAKALRGYLSDGTVPALPTGYSDQAGVLMANVQEAVTRLDLALDSAHAQRDEALLARRDKFKLLAGLSHDLRTPLNHVIGFAELMSSESLGPLGNRSYRGYADDIGSSGKDLLSVLEGVLSLSSVEAGKLPHDQALLDLETTVARSVNLIRMKANAAQVEVDFDAGSFRGLTVLSDERHLKQLLLHLCEIALAAEATGKLSVRGIGDERQVAIQVESDAPWQAVDVPPELRAKSGDMQLFSSVNSGGFDHSSPLALQLSLVNSLVAVIGATLRVGTAADGGRKMSITLALHAAPPQQELASVA